MCGGDGARGMVQSDASGMPYETEQRGPLVPVRKHRPEVRGADHCEDEDRPVHKRVRQAEDRRDDGLRQADEREREEGRKGGREEGRKGAQERT